ncbi:MAG TPA: Uma2 family endonuclease [Candidatus Binatia bacterium]|jgi:Uma2 family endonuclease|nr:Uma2 family endonuclease [Candidatus Binatia bacterium]
MATQTAFVSTETFTQREFKRWLDERPASDLNHYELLRGRIVMSPPAGWPHGSVEANILAPLVTFARTRGLGLVLGSSAGYNLPSGDTVEPDVSFISAARLAAGPTPQPGKFLRIVPDLVVEILSPATAQKDQTEKKAIYAENGVEEYWIVDSKRREITVFPLSGKRFGRGAMYTARDTLRSRVLDGFTLRVSEVFV